MSKHEALTAIQKLMDATQWDADTLESIAAVMQTAGYQIRNYDYDVTLGR
jgi:hypothetical protein